MKRNKQVNLESLVDLFKALGDSSRVKIFNKLVSAKSNLCVGMIAYNLDMTQPAVSQHLKVLKNCGLVTSDRHGSNIHYKVNLEKLNEVNNVMDQLINNVNSSNEDICISYPDKSKCGEKK